MQEPLFANHPIRQWLIKEIYVSDWIYFDGWSLVHLINGFLLGLILAQFLKGVKMYLVAFLIIVLYELWENASGQFIFATEQPLDFTWDILIGMVGVVLFQITRCIIRK